MDITNKYLSILSECTFISKMNNGFITNCNCTLENLTDIYDRDMSFKENRGTFRGLVNKSNGKKYITMLESKLCDLKDFYIIDKNKKDISDLTLAQYKAYIRDKRIDDILE